MIKDKNYEKSCILFVLDNNRSDLNAARSDMQDLHFGNGISILAGFCNLRPIGFSVTIELHTNFLPTTFSINSTATGWTCNDTLILDGKLPFGILTFTFGITLDRMEPPCISIPRKCSSGREIRTTNLGRSIKTTLLTFFASSSFAVSRSIKSYS